MISLAAAIETIIANSPFLGKIAVPVPEAVGLRLAEDVVSPISMPPFDKSAMDGYAFRWEDMLTPETSFTNLGLIQAGETWTIPVGHCQCVKIMTGASVPLSCDTVIQVEHTEENNGTVKFRSIPEKGKNICRTGEDIEKDSLVMKKEQLITLQSIALLSAVGRENIIVFRKPRIKIINTGGEITVPGTPLSQHMIYNSNGPQLEALCIADKLPVDPAVIVPDNRESLEKAVTSGLDADILLITGGVSEGDYDLVPAICQEQGVTTLFHKINVQPGKPVYFGRKNKTLVFGMPGNPVSTFLSYLLYVRTAVRAMTGSRNPVPAFTEKKSGAPFRAKGTRLRFVPVTCCNGILTPVKSNGSADILALSKADGFALLYPGKEYEAGASVGYMEI